MATGGRGSLSLGSEPFYDFSCSVCAKDDKHTEGNSFCVECNEIFCTPCLEFHNKIAIMRQHELLDQDEMVARKPQLHLLQLPTSRCMIHPGRVIDMYCGQDDVVCCTVCIAEEHRSCFGVTYIPRKAKNIQTSKEFQDVNAAIDTMKADIERLKKDKQLDLDRIIAQHQCIQAHIGEIRDQLNKHLDDLEEMARDELEKKFKIHENQINDAFAKLEKQLSEMKDIADKVKNVQSESQLFVDIKMAKINQKKGKKIYTEIEKSIGKPAIHLVPNYKLFDLLKQKYMGTIEDTKQFNSVVHHYDFNVRVNSDSKTCAISGLCLMMDGNILISDIANENLKLIDTSYKVVAESKLTGRPQRICRTGPNEVAIVLKEVEMVQLAEVTDKIYLKESFSVGERCCGIAYNEGVLYVASDEIEGSGQVQLYNKSGKHLQSFVNDKNNKTLFSLPVALSVSECRTQLHIADSDLGIVVTMNLDGTDPWKFNHPDLKWPHDICVVNNDDLIVCGFGSNNVMMFDKKGQQKAVLLKEQDGIMKPWSVLYDRPNSRLIVSMEISDKIKVYNFL